MASASGKQAVLVPPPFACVADLAPFEACGLCVRNLNKRPAGTGGYAYTPVPGTPFSFPPCVPPALSPFLELFYITSSSRLALLRLSLSLLLFLQRTPRRPQSLSTGS